MPSALTLAVVFALAGAMASGCATVTTGPRQTLRVTTQPPGASCKITREATQLGVVDPTPGTVDIEKGSTGIWIACGKAGHLPASAEAAAQFQGMTFGNVLLGGLVGLAVDAASGAMFFYPDSVHVVLVPARFDSAQERDRFFEGLSSRITQRAAGAIERLSQSCSTEKCRQELRAIERTRDEQLADLERQKAGALIGAAEPKHSVALPAAASAQADPLAAAQQHLSAQGCQGVLQPLGNQEGQELFHARCDGYELSLRCTAQTCEEMFRLPAR